MIKKIEEGNKIIPIIGLQWGDEGKGKGVARIASSLSKNDLIVRFQGGNNAGHTIWYKNKSYVFKLIPSGVFGVAQIHLGAGMVIDPFAFKKETKTIPHNISFLKRISVSPHATLVIPTHILLDSISELTKGKEKIGSTGRGIGPAYTDMVNRSALRIGDIFHTDFRKRYETLTTQHKKILLNLYNYKVDEKEFAQKQKDFWEGIKFLKTLPIIDSEKIITSTLARKNTVIAEGAQGTLLDIRFGNYPFVTSSHTVASGIGTGLGLPPSKIGGTIGIFKAYVTKVGEGPFPTELGGEQSAVWCRDRKYAYEKERYPNPNVNSKDEFEQGVALRRAGYEIGAVTGRLRRTGWLDIPLLKYAIKINNATSLVMTKLDVLDGFKKIEVCTHYIVDGKKTEEIPFDLSRTNIKCAYKTFLVWKEKLSDYRDKLPKEAITYINFLEKTLKVPIVYIGTGPKEHQVIEKYW